MPRAMQKLIESWPRLKPSERSDALRVMSTSQKKTFYNEIRLVKPTEPYKRHWLHWWVKTYLGIHIPNKKVCAHHDAPFTMFARIRCCNPCFSSSRGWRTPGSPPSPP